MWTILQSEWQKLRRCQILLVGIVALALCPVVQYGSQLIVEPAYRAAAYSFADLFANVVWGNTQLFLPISLVMTGGWLIDRERSSDTWKNLLTVPVSLPRLLSAKLLVTAGLALLFGLYSVCVTLLTGCLVGLPGLSAPLVLRGGGQIVGAAMTTYVVCMPLILVFGRLRGAYLGGSILAFFLGYSLLFFKGGVLLSAYPFSAALLLVGFDMAQYNGATTQPNLLLSVAGLGSMILLTVLLLAVSGRKPLDTPKKKTAQRSRSRGRRRR